METEAVEEVGFKEITIFEDEIGAGAYGSVHMAICDKLLCAAKRIYRILVQPSQATPSRNEHRIPIRRFEAEFKFLQEIRHPNIIQYLGMYTDPSTHLPILLMELMDESLTQYLEGSTQPIAYYIQVNICLDIMRALSFLHVNEIVHRDLSSNNILLAGKSRHAKLSDFGMAKFLNTKMSRVSNTAVPGTEVYMPPEAFGDDFKESGDIFSFAVLLIQILTQKFPKPQGKLEDRIVGNEKIKALVKELERRNNHISLIPHDHSLLPIALDCLKDEEADRPLASNLCDRLASLTETKLYTESKTTEEKPQSITEEKCVGTTECETEEKAIGTDNFDLQLLDYVHVKDEVKEKLTRTEQLLVQSKQALEESEQKILAMKDQLEAKEKVLGKEIEQNNNLIETQQKIQETLQGTENELQSISSAKTELEEKLRNLKQEIEQHQQTLIEQQKQIDLHYEKITEQNEQLATHIGKINEQEQHIKEQNVQYTTHLEKMSEKEEQIKGLQIQLEQQSSVNDNLISELSSIKDSFNNKKSRQQNKAAEKQPIENSSKASKTGADKESFFTKMKKTLIGGNKDEEVKLEEFEEITATKVNDSTQQKLDASKKQPETAVPTNEATLPKLDIDLPPNSTQATLPNVDFEGLKQTAEIHHDSGITKDVMEKWNRVDDNDQETAPDTFTSRAEQVRTKAAVNRIETSSDKSVATLTDAHRIGMLTNQALLHQGASIDKTERLQEQIQTDLKASVIPLPPVETLRDTDTQLKLPPKSRGLFSGWFGSKKEEIKESSASKQSVSHRDKLSSKSKVEIPPTRSQSNPFDEETIREAKSEEMKFREQSAIQRMEESSARSVNTLVATNAMGVSTLVELEQQSEQLHHIERDHEQMRDDLTSGRDNIETIKSPFGSRPRKEPGRKSSKGQSSQTPLPKSKPPSSKDRPQHTTTQLHQCPSTGSALVDANLDKMSEVLSQMMNTGIAQGVLLDGQSQQLERIHVLVDKNQTGFAAANRELKKQL
ncbi:probable serine/threonine-protein kinase kinX [Halichondria panicea]|uniref:probable serine/threonine-protein kinase kinX n=1 Tax=Halichondria panicea TaxID=6063 RepID=UPI00312B646C